MNRRNYGSKPRVALWMLIAVIDVALLAAAAGPLMTMLVIAGLVIVVGTFAGMRMINRREPEPAKAVRRRVQ